LPAPQAATDSNRVPAWMAIRIARHRDRASRSSPIARGRFMNYRFGLE
jgi:hypothetical protein